MQKVTFNTLKLFLLFAAIAVLSAKTLFQLRKQRLIMKLLILHAPADNFKNKHLFILKTKNAQHRCNAGKSNQKD